MMMLSHDLLILFLVAIAFIVFVAVEIAGLVLPDFHTVSYIAYRNPPVRYALLGAVALFWLWLFIHTGRPIPK